MTVTLSCRPAGDSWGFTAAGASRTRRVRDHSRPQVTLVTHWTRRRHSLYMNVQWAVNLDVDIAGPRDAAVRDARCAPDATSVTAVSVWPLEWIKDHCPEFRGDAGRDVAACRVTEWGEIGALQNEVYLYAFYCVEERDFKEAGSCDDPTSINGRHPRTSVAVFVRRPGERTIRLVTTKFAFAGDFRIPRLAANAFGTVMELGLVLAATCDCNAGSYLLRAPGRDQWQPLDWDSWQRQLAQRLPTGLTSVNGFWPDLRNMTAEGALWHDADAHCCPTGGWVRVRLGIANNAFVLQSFEVFRDLPKAR